MNFSPKQIVTSMALTALAAGGLFAAQTGPGRGHFMQKMATALNLTAQQQEQANAIFHESMQNAKPVRQQLRQERQQLQAAIHSGQSPAQIQQLASAEGPQLAQLAAIRAGAMAKFYAILTPDQQQKLAQLRQSRQQQHRRPAAQNNTGE